MRFLRTLAATILLILPLGRADVRGCACDVSKPETMAATECQLCRLAEAQPAERTGYWTAAIAKARELWGNQWGIAMNGLERRTQCHAHMHIGKLLDGVEDDGFVVVDSPADIPVPPDGTGIWIHPVGNKLHVHVGDQAAELVLER